jgi:hypothetical protein
MAPKVTAPAPAPENKPAAPEPKPSSTGQEQTGAVSSSNLASTEGLEEPAESTASAQEMEPPVAPADDDGWVGTVPQGDNGVAVEKAAFLDRSAGAGLVPGWSRLMNRRAPNYKVDIAIFASILSLALAGLWVEWRLPGRQPV